MEKKLTILIFVWLTLLTGGYLFNNFYITSNTDIIKTICKTDMAQTQAIILQADILKNLSSKYNNLNLQCPECSDNWPPDFNTEWKLFPNDTETKFDLEF